MKKICTFLITIVFISGMMTEVNAQNPRSHWHTSGWYKQIDEMTTYEAGGSNYLFLLNSDKGLAWIFRVDDDGTVGEELWHTNKWVKGLKVAAAYDINGNDYLLLVQSHAGVAWIFELTPDGKVGKQTWKTTKWDKGIAEATTYQDTTGNYVFLSNPLNGNAWLLKLNSDGTMGPITWSTSKWAKDLVAADTYEVNEKNFLVLSQPSGGNAWIFELLPEGKMGKSMDHRTWHTGITAIKTFNTAGQNYVVLSASTHGSFWSFKLTDEGKFGKDIYHTQNYAKGIDEITTYDANGVDFIVLGKPSVGRAWIFSNYHETPSIQQTGQKVTGDKAQTLQNLDQLLENVSASQKITSELCRKLARSKYEVDNVKGVANTVEGLKNKTGNVAEVLGTFNMIPTIGSLTSVLSNVLDKTADVLNGVKLTLAGLNKSAVEPSKAGIYKAWADANALDVSLLALSVKLSELKNDEQAFLTAMEDQTKRDQFMKLGTAVNDELRKLNSDVQEINNLNNKVLEVSGPVGDFNNNFKKVDNAVGKADNVAGKVDKVLSKKFKKKIFRKTISVSLKDVLTGGGLAGKVKRFTKKWTKKLLNPVLKKLKVKIPGVPGADKIVEVMNKVKDAAKKMVDRSGGLKQSSEKFVKLNAQFGAAF